MHLPVAHDYQERPLLLFWEMTKACPLACAHCRAHAQHVPMAGEMSDVEGAKFVSDIASFGSPSPIVVMTGGDPLARGDLFERIQQAKAQGTKVALAPAVSPSLRGETLSRLYESGIRAISISLDGSTALTHEGIRNVPGHFEQTKRTLAELVDHGFMVQVNTTVMRRNAEELAEIAVLLKQLGVHVWEVFFLIHVGRGTSVDELSASECEDVSHFLVDAARYGFVVRTVEAPFFRRVVTWRAGLSDAADPGEHFGLGPLYRRLSTHLRNELGAPTERLKATSAGTRDGNGILFVAHDGDIAPAGFLPLSLGNVRRESVVDVYRSNPILQAIREARFHGRCGTCEFRQVCGGSRSRAFAAYGDPLADDRACAYQPTGRAPLIPVV